MRVILRSTEHLVDQAQAVAYAMDHYKQRPDGSTIGVSYNGHYYAIRWNEKSISVQYNGPVA